MPTLQPGFYDTLVRFMRCRVWFPSTFLDDEVLRGREKERRMEALGLGRCACLLACLRALWRCNGEKWSGVERDDYY